MSETDNSEKNENYNNTNTNSNIFNLENNENNIEDNMEFFGDNNENNNIDNNDDNIGKIHYDETDHNLKDNQKDNKTNEKNKDDIENKSNKDENVDEINQISDNVDKNENNIEEIENNEINEINYNIENLEINENSDNNIELNQKNLTAVSRTWRVKLYLLNDNGFWDDRGIGNLIVFKTNNENNDSEEEENYYMIMFKENSLEQVFCVLINSTLSFRSQRGTILTWRQSQDLTDDNIAVSFQGRAGIDEVGGLLARALGKGKREAHRVATAVLWSLDEDKLEEAERVIKEEGEEIIKDPNCSFLTRLGEILLEQERKVETLKSENMSILTTQITLNEINENKENTNNADFFSFLNKININKDINFNKIDQEKKEEIINNYAFEKYKPMKYINNICNIVKSLLLLGDRDLLLLLISDQHYMTTFGALEYDFSLHRRVAHRLYFSEIAHGLNPLKIEDEEVIGKMKEDLRLLYLRDTATARFAEDNLVKNINFCLGRNYADIMNKFSREKQWINEMIKQIGTPIPMDTEDTKTISEIFDIKITALKFLRELISYTKEVIQYKKDFYELIYEYGLLPALCDIFSLKSFSDPQLKEQHKTLHFLSIEVLTNILSSIPNYIKEYLQKDDSKMLNILTDILLYDDNFGIKYEICQIYKMIMDGDFNESYFSNQSLEFFKTTFVRFTTYFRNLKSKSSKTESTKKSENSKPIRSSHSLLLLLSDLLSHFFSLEPGKSPFWLGEADLPGALEALLSFSHEDSFAALAAMKILKSIVKLGDQDPFFVVKFLEKNVCSRIIELYEENKDKKNLVMSAALSTFEEISLSSEKILSQFINTERDFFDKNANVKPFSIYMERFNDKKKFNEDKLNKKEYFINYLNGDFTDADGW